MKREIRKARQPKRWTLGSAFAYASERWGTNAEGAVRLTTWAIRRMAGHTPSTPEGRARLNANARGARYVYHEPPLPLPGEPLTLADVRRYVCTCNLRGTCDVCEANIP